MPKSDAQRDDQEASRWISAALERYERPLLVYALRFLRGDLDRARDVVQEVFLRLCRARREDVEPHLGEWLFTVCKNRALDVQRKERPMSAIDDSAARQMPGHEPAPGAQLEQQETQGQVLHLLNGLPDKQREALRLRFQHGLSYEEIARIMEESKGTVGWWIHAGIKRMRERSIEGGLQA